MKSSLPFSLVLWFLLFGSYAPGRHDLRSHAPQARQEQAEHFLCPVVTIDCPETVNSPGVPVKFTAKISGAGPSPSLTLNWSVSAGTIISGRTQHLSTPDSTADMTVDTTGVSAFTDITATVEVGGLPRSCNVQTSCTTRLSGIIDIFPIDEYGNIRFSDERARLDNFAIELQNDQTLKGYVVCYGGRRGRRGEAAARCERAKRYLFARRGIDAGRLTTVNGGFREDLTVELWVLPSRAVPPTPGPTVDPREVQFIEGPRKARKRRAGE